MDKRRINTQMPRRTKVQPSTLMASEWDIGAGSPPAGLRTPASQMKTASMQEHSISDVSATSRKKTSSKPREV